MLAPPLGSQEFELRFQRRTWIIGKSRLLFARHVDQFDAGEDDLGTCHRLEAEHGADAALDASMVLLDPIIEVLALADSDWFQ